MPPHRQRWPSSQDYRNAILDPENSFEDPDLRQAQPVCDDKGVPLDWRGGSALVFRLRWPDNPKKDFAVRCFRQPIAGRRERYRRLTAHLNELRQQNRLPPFMVDFQYLRDQAEEGQELQGIFIDDEWFPVVKMTWVEGLTLREIVEKYRHGKRPLEILCQFWERLARQLDDAQIAHLDLQHGNILWMPGKSETSVKPRLIDYDGMWIPSLAESPSGEGGVIHYQHPERHPVRTQLPVYRPEADRFSHLVIYSALRSLADLGPDLWDAHNNADGLLFSSKDFTACRRPDQVEPSKLLQRLWTQGTEEVKTLAGRLVLAANGPLAEVPALSEVVADARVQPLTPAQIGRVQKILGLEPGGDNSLGMKFARIPKGTFWMSANDQNAQRQVTIAEDFELGIYQVTQEQWQAVMGTNPSWFSRTGGGKDKVNAISDADLKQFPVEQVSWEDAQQFLAKLNEKERKSRYLYRLPTEAEWEYACREGANVKEACSFDFYLGQPSNDLSSTQANFNGNYPAGSAAKGPYLERTTKVGSYPGNRLGLFDIHGNVYEWCQDLYEEGGSRRVRRSGSWSLSGRSCLAANRIGSAPSSRRSYLGLRLVRVPVR